MNTNQGTTTGHGLRSRRGIRIVLGAACTAALAAAAVVGVPLASAATHSPRTAASGPTSDTVGTGSFGCKDMTGEVGYSPPSVKGGKAAETISIWFVASDCGGKAEPLPKSVIGSMSFSSTQRNTCPLLGSFGTNDTLNLTYNYPPVPTAMIDPSVATKVSVSQSGAYWVVKGTVTAGSYLSSAVALEFHPVVISPQSCSPPGITSEWISRAQGAQDF